MVTSQQKLKGFSEAHKSQGYCSTACQETCGKHLGGDSVTPGQLELSACGQRAPLAATSQHSTQSPQHVFLQMPSTITGALFKDFQFSLFKDQTSTSDLQTSASDFYNCRCPHHLRLLHIHSLYLFVDLSFLQLVYFVPLQ